MIVLVILAAVALLALFVWVRRQGRAHQMQPSGPPDSDV